MSLKEITLIFENEKYSILKTTKSSIKDSSCLRIIEWYTGKIKYFLCLKNNTSLTIDEAVKILEIIANDLKSKGTKNIKIPHNFLINILPKKSEETKRRVLMEVAQKLGYKYVIYRKQSSRKVKACTYLTNDPELVKNKKTKVLKVSSTFNINESEELKILRKFMYRIRKYTSCKLAKLFKAIKYSRMLIVFDKDVIATFPSLPNAPLRKIDNIEVIYCYLSPNNREVPKKDKVCIYKNNEILCLGKRRKIKKVLTLKKIENMIKKFLGINQDTFSELQEVLNVRQLCLRIPKSYREEIKKLIKQGKYQSIAEFIEKAINELLKQIRETSQYNPNIEVSSDRSM